MRAAAHNAGPPCALHGSPSLGSSEGEQVFVSSSPSSMMVSSLPQSERAASASSPDWHFLSSTPSHHEHRAIALSEEVWRENKRSLPGGFIWDHRGQVW